MVLLDTRIRIGMPGGVPGAVMRTVLGTVVGVAFVTAMLESGQLPAEPLGVTATVFGFPLTYVGAIVLFDVVLVVLGHFSSPGLSHPRR